MKKKSIKSTTHQTLPLAGSHFIRGPCLRRIEAGRNGDCVVCQGSIAALCHNMTTETEYLQPVNTASSPNRRKLHTKIESKYDIKEMFTLHPRYCPPPQIHAPPPPLLPGVLSAGLRGHAEIGLTAPEPTAG